jgi:hypothetical protein
MTAVLRESGAGSANAGVRGAVAMHAGVYSWTVTLDNVGGSYTDVGICTAQAALHRGDYEALLG